ncbi:FHA domain-containing protein [Cellulomonas sp. zg-ZUI222]|uniref:FHA domain-containing protein n=1 Tax=Cellulomonas wangleii TaxID=2816956 RepID=A0ABX8D6U1_9CELL|nr:MULTISPECIES: FHA domain-containing protein [Cellulomonas]MBO0898829.1 FHA domain-containing protein [Cellulomonas sp. zg-ZUI22]MBO0919691.1 FHA domain-containing protein [Cellulomonas wangleii]MBO0923882.1 FHA domain-containing protein [Cellulomonas wangleii]MBO0924164.1 FHA domain-containing protein [Cellulomonas wangleii]QVI62186.1 FHA domain-containing protein [Cellulomonas wangleii]
MTRGAPAGGPTVTRISPWPRVTAVLHSPTTATLIVNDTEHACSAPSAARLRTGLLARATAVAATVDRPVRLRLASAGGGQLLAVHPDGAVHALDDQGRTSAAPLPAPQDTGCRRCGTPQPVVATTCARCGALEPHRVEDRPVPVLDVAALTLPDAALAERLHGTRDEAAHPDVSQAVLEVDGRPPVTFHGEAALGRNPSAAPGRTPVVVRSPGMLVSKTHALVSVDPQGVLRVTDCGSTNGTTVLGDPPLPLSPGQAHVVPSGTTVRLGDVSCRIVLV